MEGYDLKLYNEVKKPLIGEANHFDGLAQDGLKTFAAASIFHFLSLLP